MKRLLSVVLALAACIMPMMAYSHSEYLQHMAAFERQIAQGKLEAAAVSASKAAINSSKVQNYQNAFKVLAGMKRNLTANNVSTDSLPGAWYLIYKT
ncbi:MAG: hypothetical protein K2M19_09035, partial [Muribaculaceae bacterium]|nr:hypothetical protein [Muribaculaceae bacterium]